MIKTSRLMSVIFFLSLLFITNFTLAHAKKQNSGSDLLNAINLMTKNIDLAHGVYIVENNQGQLNFQACSLMVNVNYNDPTATEKTLLSVILSHPVAHMGGIAFTNELSKKLIGAKISQNEITLSTAFDSSVASIEKMQIIRDEMGLLVIGSNSYLDSNNIRKNIRTTCQFDLKK